MPTAHRAAPSAWCVVVASDDDCKIGSKNKESSDIDVLKTDVTREPLKISRISKFYSVFEIKHGVF